MMNPPLFRSSFSFVLYPADPMSSATEAIVFLMKVYETWLLSIASLQQSSSARLLYFFVLLGSG